MTVTAPKNAKGLSQSQIESQLIERHQGITGGAGHEGDEAEPVQRTFYHPDAPGGLEDTGKLPAKKLHALLPSEVSEKLTPEEAKKAGFQVTNQRTQAHGEESAYDMGWEAYIEKAKEDAGGPKAGLSAAKDFFRNNPNDPEAAFLTALHDKLGSGSRAYSKMGMVDPSKLKAGDTFRVGGTDVRVEDEGTGDRSYLVLKDGGDLPDTPVEAMEKVPVDKSGTLRTQEKTEAAAEKPETKPAQSETQPPVRETKAPNPETPTPDVQPVESATSEPRSIGLSKEDLSSIREELDLHDAPEQQVRHAADVLDIAKKNRLDETAEEAAHRANEHGQPLSDEDYAGAVVRYRDLRKRYESLVQEAREAEASGDTITADKARQDAEAVRARVQSLADAVDLSTSSAGRSLGIIAKLRIDPDTVDLAHEIRVFEKSKGEKSTAAERAQIESLTKILVEAQKERDAALKREAKKDAVIAAQRAGQVLTSQRITAESGRKPSAARERLAIERNEIKKQLFSLTRRANDITGIAPEALYLLGKLAINHIRDGALTLAEVAKRVKEDAKEHFPDMTDDDVNLALTSKDPARQMVAKNATEKRVEALKREAALQQKLSDQAEKMKTEAPSKSMAAQTKMVLDQLRLSTKDTIDAGRRRDAIIAKIDALKQNLAEQSRPIKGKKPATAPADIQSLRDQVDALKKSMRTQDTLADLQDQIKTGDFKTAARPEPKPVSSEVQAAQIKIIKARAQIKKMVDDAKPTSTPKKVADVLTHWTRDVAMLTHVSTIEKLLGAAGARMATSPIENAAALGFTKVFPRLAEDADVPKSAQMLARSEAAAHTRLFGEGMRASWDMLRNRRTTLELEHGETAPRELIEYAGNLHGAIKEPVKQAAFARSLSTRNENSILRGENPADPMVQLRNSAGAYEDANAEIFKQHNAVADGFNNWLTKLETPNEKLTKGQNLGRLVGATMLRVGFPIVKIPLNFVSETANYTAGLPVGLARVAHAYATGFDGLKPVEKTAIIRQLSKGSLGAAVFMLGFCNPNNVGGYYQKYEKREADEAQAGGAKLFGTNIPRILLHNPLLEVAQIGATLRRVSDSRSKKTQEDPNGLGVGMLAAGLGVIDEIPFVSGTTALDKLSDPSQRSSALGRMIASRTIPGGLDWIAQETDRDYDGPIKRKPTTVLENLKAGIPGLRQTVPLAPEPKK